MLFSKFEARIRAGLKLYSHEFPSALGTPIKIRRDIRPPFKSALDLEIDIYF